MPVFASYTLAFALQLRKKHGKTSVRVAMGNAINAADLQQNLEVLLYGEMKMFVIQKF